MQWHLLQAQPRRLLLLVPLLYAKAQVSSVSPTSGSFCGGTRLSISGSGFVTDNPSANRVEIAGGECKIESVSDGTLVCRAPYRDAQVIAGNESTTEPITVYANGKPLSGSLEFTFEAKGTATIVDWGPSTGQANDVLSFQGKETLASASVEMSGQECKVKHSDDIYLQCVPPPREAGVSNVEVYFGPDRGFACPGPKVASLKFTYNLALQSALPSDWESDTEGPLDGGGQLTGGPCSPRTPPSATLDVIGQGLGNSTRFKLCGGETWCEVEGPVVNDPEIYHGGDWSYQKVTCRPGPLDPSKAPGGIRKCDLTAEVADGMFVATLPDAWTFMTTTYVVTTTAPTTKETSTTSLPSVPPSTTLSSSTTWPSIAVVPTTTPASVIVMAPAPAMSPYPPPLPEVPSAEAAPSPSKPPGLLKEAEKQITKMTTKVLSKTFKDLFKTLDGALKKPSPGGSSEKLPKAASILPPPIPQSVTPVPHYPMPPNSPPQGLKNAGSIVNTDVVQIKPPPLGLVPGSPAPASEAQILLLQSSNAGHRTIRRHDEHSQQTEMEVATPVLRGGFRV